MRERIARTKRLLVASTTRRTPRDRIPGRRLFSGEGGGEFRTVSDTIHTHNTNTPSPVGFRYIMVCGGIHYDVYKSTKTVIVFCVRLLLSRGPEFGLLLTSRPAPTAPPPHHHHRVQEPRRVDPRAGPVTSSPPRRRYSTRQVIYSLSSRPRSRNWKIHPSSTRDAYIYIRT